MSSPLAIAGVSAVLKSLLDNALAADPLTAAVTPPVQTKLVAPPKENPTKPQLNLYLYHVTANSGWRNEALPSRNGSGDRLSNPPLALDLHYMLTVFGPENFQSESLLGYAMQAFHETPFLTRDMISASLVASGIGGTDLENQIEQIKIVPEYLGTEEMSRIWTAMQTPYNTSMAYCVTVVLIQAAKTARTPLPVLTRGAFDPILGRDEGVKVQPDMFPPFATLLSVDPPASQAAVRLAETLTLAGHRLSGDIVSLLLTLPRPFIHEELPALAGATESKFQVSMLNDPDAWRPGVYSVAARVQIAGSPDQISNVLPLVLAPSLTAITVSVPGPPATLQVTCSPKVVASQTIALIVGSLEVAPDPIGASPTDTLTFTSAEFPAGHQWVRLRVDGVESILVDRSVTPPLFVASQAVVI